MAAPTLSFVPKSSPSSSTAPVALDDIPQDIKDQVEEVYTVLKTNEGNMHVEFPTKMEMLAYERLVKSYCELRPAGPIHYRRSPVRNQPEGHANFRITDVPTKNAEVAKDINDGVKAVKAAAAAKK